MPRKEELQHNMAAEIDPLIPVVKNILILDSEGKRIAVKYYSSSEW